jgi:hypothetical protein
MLIAETELVVGGDLTLLIVAVIDVGWPMISTITRSLVYPFWKRHVVGV